MSPFIFIAVLDFIIYRTPGLNVSTSSRNSVSVEYISTDRGIERELNKLTWLAKVADSSTYAGRPVLLG